MASTAASLIGKKIIVLDTIDSTNAFVSRMLAENIFDEGMVVSAKAQLSGKGSSGNSWHSEEGKNLLLSVIISPTFLSPRHQFFLNQISSLAVANTIESFLLNSSVKIKWPNDVYVDDRKIAGILIENSVQGDRFRTSIIGIGININQKKFHRSLSKATSFFKILDKEISLEEVMEELLSQIEKRYLQLKQKRIDLIQKDYMKKLYRVEESSWFSSYGKKFKGKIVGITAEGKLIIETSGKHEVFGFKEVEMII